VGTLEGADLRDRVAADAALHLLGFGILMTRHLVDELVYNQRGNEVLFVRYLP
jgi:hypothetical protein